MKSHITCNNLGSQYALESVCICSSLHSRGLYIYVQASEIIIPSSQSFIYIYKYIYIFINIFNIYSYIKMHIIIIYCLYFTFILQLGHYTFQLCGYLGLSVIYYCVTNYPQTQWFKTMNTYHTVSSEELTRKDPFPKSHCFQQDPILQVVKDLSSSLAIARSLPPPLATQSSSQGN